MERRLRIRGARRKLVVGTIGVLAAGGGLLALGPAAASGATHASSVSLQYVPGHHQFQGKVKSDTPDCEIGRSVTLFAKTAGHHTAVGSAHTNYHGFYKIGFPLTPGVYYATARSMTLPGYSNTVCERATSFFRVIS